MISASLAITRHVGCLKCTTTVQNGQYQMQWSKSEVKFKIINTKTERTKTVHTMKNLPVRIKVIRRQTIQIVFTLIEVANRIPEGNA